MEIRSKRFNIYYHRSFKRKAMIKEITEEKITELEKKSLRSWDKALGIRQDYLGGEKIILLLKI